LSGWTGREVLERDDHAKRVRPLEEANEGAFLELGALADARAGGARGIREVQAVVGDGLGARLRGVVEQDEPQRASPLQPAQPGLLVRRQQSRRGPGVALQVEAEPVVHSRVMVRHRRPAPCCAVVMRW
jgi:hypothetical protein